MTCCWYATVITSSVKTLNDVTMLNQSSLSRITIFVCLMIVITYQNDCSSSSTVITSIKSKHQCMGQCYLQGRFHNVNWYVVDRPPWYLPSRLWFMQGDFNHCHTEETSKHVTMLGLWQLSFRKATWLVGVLNISWRENIKARDNDIMT